MKMIVKDIIASLETEPSRWRVAGYTWRRDDGLEIWRRNGPILFIQIYAPYELSLSLLEKIHLHFAFRKWNKAMSLDSFLRKPA